MTSPLLHVGTILLTENSNLALVNAILFSGYFREENCERIIKSGNVGMNFTSKVHGPFLVKTFVIQMF